MIDEVEMIRFKVREEGKESHDKRYPFETLALFFDVMEAKSLMHSWD